MKANPLSFSLTLLAGSFALLTTPSLLIAQQGPGADTLRAHVYSWKSLDPQKDSSRDRRQFLDGSTHDLANLEIHASTIDPGKVAHPPHTHADMEELVIVKEGTLKGTIKDKTMTLGPGSIGYAIPGDEHGFVNVGREKATYYVLKFKARAPMDANRGARAGGSFLIDWNTLAVQKTEKGERRQVFDRPTTLFGKFEVHVTALNPGEVSHAPHVHRQEEIILLRKGDVTMQIGENFYKASAGDLIFLSSGIPHALRNTGSTPCEYYALQWQ
ncbi:MAG TPA: cupin domain-containing protein [Puia sp.]|nr:cupin domain-containing protein [Puia sp.]